ncbi:MAG: DUF2071 domain-containing protein [Planctomycetales bacterium]|nr:DUF2071 domain-containing protein [Planctomycetales bacterium]
MTATQSAIDRLGPTRRPDLPIAGTQQWRSLLFLHWTAPVELLRPLVPRAFELDSHDGVAYVGLVPFAMQKIWSVRWPRFIAFNFLETNVRTYVHYRGRPGVYFLSLDASSWLAVKGARMGWGLPYYFAQAELNRKGADPSLIHFHSRRRGGIGHVTVEYETGAWLGASRPQTLEHFLLERYLLFVERRGRVLEGQVYHTPYPAQQATVTSVEESLLAAAGLPTIQGPPTLAHYAEGVDVEIFPLRDVTVSRHAD